MTGRLPFEVPRLGLGTAPLGGLFAEVAEADAAATLEAAAREGITYFDTAPRYGHGQAEDRLGRLLAPAGVTAPLISTKTGWLWCEVSWRRSRRNCSSRSRAMTED
jgi:D-threo-aldose 1-dehydrogenase